MSEKPEPDRVPDEETPPHPAEPLQIDTPVIDIQDLEHKPGPTTRVSNKGVKIEPRIDSDDHRDQMRDDEQALLALEQIEQALHGQLHG
jgi:hypothetical protein